MRWNVYFWRRRLGTVVARDRNHAIRKAIKTFGILLPHRRRVDVRAIETPRTNEEMRGGR
jgi:hypothetical protein